MEPSLVWLVWATKGVSIGAVVLQVLEFFNDIVDEVEYIWRGRIRPITYLYAWLRYFPLLGQVVNIVFSEMMYATPTWRMCTAGNIIKGTFSQLTTTCVEAILMIRVHALYNCSYRSRNILSSVFIVGTTLEVIGTVSTISHVQPGATGSICVPAHTSIWRLSFFLVGCGLIEGVLLFLTLSKIVASNSSGWFMRTPIISLMLRDGISFFFIITIVIASIVIFEIFRGLNESVFVWNIAFSWYICLLSIAVCLLPIDAAWSEFLKTETQGCRMIINMRKLGVRPNSRNRQTVYDPTLTQFSTIIDIAEYSTDHICTT